MTVFRTEDTPSSRNWEEERRGEGTCAPSWKKKGMSPTYWGRETGEYANHQWEVVRLLSLIVPPGDGNEI